jgi:hypothetical protein
MMDFGVVFSPLLGPAVGATRPFSDWMRAAETVCTTLAHAGFRSIVFTHSYQYGGTAILILEINWYRTAIPAQGPGS